MTGSRAMSLIGVAGSLRAGSFNRALLRAAAGLMPAGAVLTIADIRGIPLYDGDREAAEGIPPAVSSLKDAIASADGLVLATPEYNNAMPGVLKNAIDWLSRPSVDIPRVFGDRPVAIMGASPGRFGTILAQQAWLPVIRALGMRPWFGEKLMVPGAARVFSQDGAILDESVQERLRSFLDGFVSFARSERVG